MKPGAIGEIEGVAQIRGAVAAPADGQVGIGDDAAVLSLEGRVLACHDLLVEDVHFRLAGADLEAIGHKALAVNLSDMAAMGGVPRAVLVGLTLPPEGMASQEVALLYRGMEALARSCGAAIVGGDTTRGCALSLAVTVLGTVPPGGEPLLRSQGRPGDLLCVTGPLGAAAAGLALSEGRVSAEVAGEAADALIAALERPEARLDDGAAIARAGARAAIDISDGLALDSWRLATESGCGARIDLDRIPLAPGVRAVAGALGREPDEFAAGGGEDYELLFAADRATLERIGRVLRRTPSVVGALTDCGDLLVRRAGEMVDLAERGWERA